jgi:hypothetical protein
MQLSILPSIGPFLTRLSQSGVREQDIVDIAELLKDNTGISNSSKKYKNRRNTITNF